MAGLQRSAVSFRRQGSSGLVWDDKFLSGELNQKGGNSSNSKAETQQEIQGLDVKDDQLAKTSSRTAGGSIERSRSNGGGRGYRTGRVSPAIEPPSPKVSACGFCSAFGKQENNGSRRPPKSGKRKM